MKKQDAGKKGPDTLGKRIRKIRGDLTQVEFANAVDIRQAMVSRYEADKETPSPKVLLRMSRYSGKSIEWLLTGFAGLAAQGEKASAGKGAVTKDDLIEAAARDLLNTQVPAAERFVEMMKDLFANRKRMERVLDFHGFVKKEE